MIFIILVIILVVLILYHWLCLIKDSSNISILGPVPIPVLGNGHLFFGDSTKFLRVLRGFSKKYGGLTRFYILSHRYIFMTDTKFIEALTTSTELITKGRSYSFLLPWLGQGLLTSTGLKWKTHRKFLTPAFHFNILQSFLPVFLKNEKILINELRNLADGRAIELFPIIALAALDNVTESIMGVSINAQTDKESEYVKAINNLSMVLAYRMRNPLASEEAIFKFMKYKKVQDEAIQYLHKQSEKVIEARRAELKNLNITTLNYDAEYGIKNKHAFLDLLLLSEIDGERITDREVREEVDTFMFEGHDTTTSGIVFCLYCIAKHKDVQEKIMNEQKLVLGDDDRDPSFSELQKMKYLELVIKESLRIYPSVPMIERRITKDTDLAGVYIPKDTSILVSFLEMQRDPKNFENPLEFIPERFENSLKNPFTWLAFSAGPRNCIGQKFAMLEMKTTIAAIVRRFKLYPATRPEPDLTLDLILRSNNGVYICLEER